ncbi:hypothetical protein MCHI_000491 [Candidatus Magnetoovum chiemensis]|nr:hypothetical protein MCHI_000491 [Candidatus Magnetoovum chiemensis]
MIKISNNRGFALVLVMLFSLVAVTLTAALIYMSINTTKLVGTEQRYHSSLDAGKAFTDVMINYILSYPGVLTPDYGNLIDSLCMRDKLTSETFSISSGAYQWTNCNGYGTQAQITSPTDADIKNYADITSSLGKYTVYTKIVNTILGIDSSDCTGSGCLYYSVEVLTENTANTVEKSRISFLYRLDSN